MKKQERIYAMLMRREGATRDELIEMTGWKSISVQAECKQGMKSGRIDGWRENIIDGVKVFYAWRRQEEEPTTPHVRIIQNTGAKKR